MAERRRRYEAMNELVMIVGSVCAGVAVIGLGYVVGMRRKSRVVLGPMIAFQRALMNPMQMRTAGTPAAYAGIVHHRGRTSGRDYTTPVGIVPVDDGFVIALVYGARTNWLRNVLAAGSATIVHEGRTFPVDRPEVVRMTDVIDHFPASDRRGFRLLRVEHALRVRRAGGDADATSLPVGAAPSAHLG
jgi:deazaflavin-dependent oxidoreductase (nitroreductase family)